MATWVRAVQRRVVGAVVDLWFPPTCPACRAPLPEKTPRSPFCDDCEGMLSLIRGAACRTCGAPVAPVGTAGETCPLCVRDHLRVDRTIALGVYEGVLRELVLKTKHRAGTVVTLSLGRMLAERVAAGSDIPPVDVVIPVPMHWRRRLVRGGNGPDLIAECLARRLNVPLARQLLWRKRNTRPQVGLSRTDRLQNVRDSMAKRSGYHLNAAQVLLVDDVRTTGGTASEAARVLKEAGAAEVTLAVVARGIGAT